MKLRKLSAPLVCCLVLISSLANFAFAQPSAPPTVYVDAAKGFQTSLTAAIIRKKVPITVVTDKANAEYVLKAAPVDSKDESGAGKIARCLFLDCIGVNGYSEVSVQLTRQKDTSVVWAYQVRKANSGPLGVQSLSEAIAKHLNNDYLKKRDKAQQ